MTSSGHQHRGGPGHRRGGGDGRSDGNREDPGRDGGDGRRADAAAAETGPVWGAAVQGEESDGSAAAAALLQVPGRD